MSAVRPPSCSLQQVRFCCCRFCSLVLVRKQNLHESQPYRFRPAEGDTAPLIRTVRRREKQDGERTAGSELCGSILKVRLWFVVLLCACAWTHHVVSCRLTVSMAVQLWCLSFRQPYAGLVLDGVKTVESRWRPLLVPLENRTLAVHIAWRDWEGEEWRAVLGGAWGLSAAGVQELLESGERFGRGVVAGLVDVGGTWQCPASLPEAELTQLQRSAVLIGLEQKHLTWLSNPRWLKGPLKAPGGRDLWTVEIPAELLP